jgi:hypothetical protein
MIDKAEHVTRGKDNAYMTVLIESPSAHLDYVSTQNPIDEDANKRGYFRITADLRIGCAFIVFRKK